MKLIKHTTDWVRGEVYQGKIMLVLGSLVLILVVTLNSSERELLNGMLIPIGLIALVLMVYGGMQIMVRPKHLKKITILYNETPLLAIETELKKSKKDNALFKILKKIWPISMVISFALYFVFSNPYYQGLALGFLGFFMTLYMLDSVLHHRLKTYLNGIKSLPIATKEA